jgi:ATP-dependent Clp protease adaptor protein ClpS
MTIVLAFRLLLIIAIVALLVWFVRQVRRERQAARQQAAQQAAAFQQQLAHALAIMERGGPQNREEYFAIFPDACPHCGARTRYVGLDAGLSAALPVPLAPSAPQFQSVWACLRCGYGNAPPLTADTTPPIQCVTSPYLEPIVAESIPELPYGPNEIPASSAEISVEPLVEGILPASGDDQGDDPVWHIYIKNDDRTPMDFVVNVLQAILEVSDETAIRAMLDAHHTGEGLVIALAWHEAKARGTAVIHRAREQGYPLMVLLRHKDKDIVQTLP